MNYTFISGATGGVGSAFALECAKRGYNLFLTARCYDKLLDLKAKLLHYNVQIEIFDCDLTVLEKRNKMLEYIDHNGLKFERIINVAGVDIQKPFVNYTSDKLLFQIRVNVESTTHLTYELLKRCAINTEIITISSMSGVSPMPNFAVYSASKAYLTNLFTALHYELKDKGVKTCVVLPGAVPTRPDIIEDIKGQGLWGKLSQISPENLAIKSLKAVKRNKTKFVPGFFNKLLYVFMKLAPKKLVLTFIKKRWAKQTKDAF